MIGNGSKNQKVNGSLCFFKCNNDFKKKSFILNENIDSRMVPLE